MTRAELLELERLSTADLNTLRTAHPDLYKALDPKITSARQTTILDQFSGVSPALRDRLRRISFSTEGNEPLDAQVAKAVGSNASPELLQEAATRLAELQRAGALQDPAETAVAIKDHPLFQEELQKARVLRMAEGLRLNEERAEKLVAALADPAAITDDGLEKAVGEGVLSDAEAQTLGLTATLHALADDQPALAEAIRKVGQVKAVTDLARLDAAAFRRAIETAQAEPSAGEDADEWAARLADTAAALFPADAFAHRVTPRRVTLEAAPELARLNPGLELDAVLASTAPEAEKLKTINARLGLVAKVRELNPDLDLLALDYTPGSDDLQKLEMTGVSDDDQQIVLRNLKAQQRAFSLTGDVDQSVKLLAAGYHSSQKIAGADVATIATDAGLEVQAARRIKYNAENRLAAVTSLSGALLDLVRGFGVLGIGNVMPTIDDYLRKIPGYSDLFGDQAYCKCEHCQSILGPAAYFVDLMKFIEENVLKKVFTGPRANHVLHLKSRRPDLWTLPLTCENTNTLIPYLDIINEVLENYIAKRRGFAGNLADRKAVGTAVYEQALAALVDSFHQPFVLPLARVDEYLKMTGSSRAAVARALRAPAVTVTSGQLRVSDAERVLIVQPNTTIAFLRNVYGVNFTLNGAQVQPVNAQELLRFTGLTRDNLGDLAATTFVSPTPASAMTIKAEKSSTSSVQNDVERVHGLTAESTSIACIA